MIPFEPKRPYQELGLVLRQELIENSYKVGDRLPPERDIAERLNVSRTVVREALIMLELENLVEVKKDRVSISLISPTNQIAVKMLLVTM